MIVHLFYSSKAPPSSPTSTPSHDSKPVQTLDKRASAAVALELPIWAQYRSRRFTVQHPQLSGISSESTAGTGAGIAGIGAGGGVAHNSNTYSSSNASPNLSRRAHVRHSALTINLKVGTAELLKQRGPAPVRASRRPEGADVSGFFSRRLAQEKRIVAPPPSSRVKQAVPAPKPPLPASIATAVPPASTSTAANRGVGHARTPEKSSASASPSSSSSPATSDSGVDVDAVHAPSRAILVPVPRNPPPTSQVHHAQRSTPSLSSSSSSSPSSSSFLPSSSSSRRLSRPLPRPPPCPPPSQSLPKPPPLPQPQPQPPSLQPSKPTLLPIVAPLRIMRRSNFTGTVNTASSSHPEDEISAAATTAKPFPIAPRTAPSLHTQPYTRTTIVTYETKVPSTPSTPLSILTPDSLLSTPYSSGGILLGADGESGNTSPVIMSKISTAILSDPKPAPAAPLPYAFLASDPHPQPAFETAAFLLRQDSTGSAKPFTNFIPASHSYPLSHSRSSSPSPSEAQTQTHSAPSSPVAAHFAESDDSEYEDVPGRRPAPRSHLRRKRTHYTRRRADSEVVLSEAGRVVHGHPVLRRRASRGSLNRSQSRSHSRSRSRSRSGRGHRAVTGQQNKRKGRKAGSHKRKTGLDAVFVAHGPGGRGEGEWVRKALPDVLDQLRKL